MIAGQLEIVMMANMARLADDMSKAKSTVGGAMKSIEGAVASAKSALGALGIGLGVGYFVTLVKGTIDAMDHLNDLSKTTNIAVESLAGLRVAAKQSGGDLDSIAASINKLSVEMGKSPDKFRALGVSAKDPLEAFKQLSDIFVALEDPQQRAAVMAEALGKSWAGAAPLLAEGGKKIGEMVERGTKFSGVTTEMARQADELNDKWILLGGTGGMLVRIVAPLLPLMNTLSDEMLKAKDSAYGLNLQFSPMLELMKILIILGTDVAFVFKMIGGEIGATMAKWAALARLDFKGADLIAREWIADREKARADLDAFQKRVAGGGGAAKSSDGGAMDMGGSGTIFSDASARAKKFLGGNADDEKQAQQIRDIMHAVREADDKRELDQISVQNAARLEADRIYNEQVLQQQEALQEETDRITREAVLGRLEFEKQARADQMAGALSFTSDLASLMNTQSKKAFELGKIASIANALIKGYESAVSSYAFGAKIGGPPLGAAFAAASIIATANLINNIRSQNFGGGGGGGGAAGGAPVSSGQGSSNFTPQQAPAREVGQTTIIDTSGLRDDDIFSGKTMRRWLESLEKQTRKGGRVVLA